MNRAKLEALTDADLDRWEAQGAPGELTEHEWYDTFGPERVGALIAEVRRLRAIEAAIQPGHMEAFVAGMFREAERLGHSPVSAKHALTYLVKEIERLRAEHACQHGTICCGEPI